MSPDARRDVAPAAPKVFICYRREESAAHAGRLHDAMAARFGEDNVFMDVGMDPGVDFVERIKEVVDRCHVLLVIMGPDWASSTGEDGEARIADPGDFVRLEVEAGLSRPDLTLIPLLVSGARVPRGEDLPGEVESLARRNALELSDSHWRYDVSRLNETLDRLLGSAPTGAAGTASLLESSVGRLTAEGAAIAAVAAGCGRLLGTLIDKPEAGNGWLGYVAAIGGTRAIAWGLVGIALSIWLALRVDRAKLASWGLLGLLVGAIAGLVGGAIWALAVELTELRPKGDPAGWVDLGAFAVTGGMIGALVGGLWRPRQRAAGLLGGLLGGAFAQLIYIGPLSDVSQPVKFGIAGAAVAAAAVAASAALSRQPAAPFRE